MKTYHKFRQLVRQYGLKQAFVHIVLQLVKPVYQINSYYILAIKGHKQKNMLNSKVKEMNRENMNLLNDMLDDKERIRFNNMLDCGKGFYIQDRDKICACGFVQTEGSYCYRGQFIYYLPQNVNVLKNLYVKPEYRGRSYGKDINEARINSMPDNTIPVVFVIPENRYAIRNLEMFGFEKYIFIKHIVWFIKYKKRYIKVVKEDELANSILRGFKDL